MIEGSRTLDKISLCTEFKLGVSLLLAALREAIWSSFFNCPIACAFTDAAVFPERLNDGDTAISVRISDIATAARVLWRPAPVKGPQ